MASSMRKQLHAVAIPLPGQGHINPLMRFCKRLASQEGFTITFVDIVPIFKSEERISNESTHANTEEHTSIDATTSPGSLVAVAVEAEVEAAAAAAAAHKQLDIRRARIPFEIPKCGEGASMFENFFGALHSLAPSIEELLSKLNHEDPPFTCLISDIFMAGPTQKVVDKFNIPRIAFNTGSQSTLLFTNYILQGMVSLEDVLKVVGTKEGSKEDCQH